MTNTVNAVYKDGMHFAVDVNGHTIDIDASEQNGGKNIGPSPKVFMLLSLAGCTGFDIVSILKKMRVDFSDFSVRVDGDLTEGQPVIYDHASIHYSIKLAEEDRGKMERAVAMSKNKYCGVSRMFESFAKVDFEIHYL
ncbi:MAG: OsmC family protein [Chitinophagaceae bacterium]|nr:OsmC family protein [Chitinophagaceae bacterium]